MKPVYLMLFIASMASACTPRGFSPPPDIEDTLTSRFRPTVDQIKKVLDECGHSQPLRKLKNESLDNARARVQECLFAKGYYFKSGYAGVCANPEYQTDLPACRNAPVRPRNSYYGP